MSIFVFIMRRSLSSRTLILNKHEGQEDPIMETFTEVVEVSVWACACNSLYTKTK